MDWRSLQLRWPKGRRERNPARCDSHRSMSLSRKELAFLFISVPTGATLIRFPWGFLRVLQRLPPTLTAFTSLLLLLTFFSMQRYSSVSYLPLSVQFSAFLLGRRVWFTSGSGLVIVLSEIRFLQYNCLRIAVISDICSSSQKLWRRSSTYPS